MRRGEGSGSDLGYSLRSPGAEGDATFDGAGSDNIEGLLAGVEVKCRRNEDHHRGEPIRL